MADDYESASSYYWVYFDENMTLPTWEYPDSNSIVIPIVIAVISILALSANCLVIYIVVSFPSMHTVTNFYILNLAVCDLLFIIVCAPVVSVIYTLPDWIMGEFMCKLNAYIQYVTVQASCSTLTMMTLDRLYVIQCPLTSRFNRTTGRVSVIIAMIWLMSFILHIPPALYYKVEIQHWHHQEATKTCRPVFPSVQFDKGYTIYSTIITYVIPLVIISVCYVLILKLLWGLRQFKPEDEALADGHSQTASTVAQKWRATRMVLTVVLVFGFCWAPIHIFNLWMLFDNSSSVIKGHIRVFCISLIYANAFFNPVIYALAGSSFRQCLRELAFGRRTLCKCIRFSKKAHIRLKGTYSSMYHKTSKRRPDSPTASTLI
ncbi:G-protein coupled receptor 54-like [Anneissia japonica]|uniref:G-protein coupled receptor 54-like n=1 Tax=Anneissia japonica TaxID=1529436 RepID=UPI00142594DE|nr:G-protein coupled receptor 54-like [Anneissia japonica]